MFGRTCAVFGITALNLCAAHGAWLIEDFNESGPLVGASPKSGGATWIPKRKYPSSGELFKARGALQFDAAFARDVEIDLVPMSGVTMYAGFSIHVSKAPTQPWILPISFMGSNESAGDAIGRLFISVGSSSTTCKVGVTNDADQVTWADRELLVGKNYRLILAFTEDANEDFTQLWLQQGESAVVIASADKADVTPYLSGVGLNHTNSDAVMSLDALYVSENFQAAMNYSDAPWLEVQGSLRRSSSQRKTSLRGQAWDCRKLQKVEFRDGRTRRFRRTEGTDKWAATARLKTGSNRILVRAVGSGGRKSKSMRVIVTVGRR